jgi:hypothetical protein
MRFDLSEELSQMLEIVMEQPTKQKIKIIRKIIIIIYYIEFNNDTWSM